MMFRKNTSIGVKLIFLALAFSMSSLSAKTYITEEKVQIDRCACAWYIARFLDEEPTFLFIQQGQKAPAGITYDFFGANYFHKGPDCSFTAFIKTHMKKKNPALISINAIVNDVFAWRNGPNSLSIAIKKYIDTLADAGKSDNEIYQECMVVFDLLYLKNGGDPSRAHASGISSFTTTEKQSIQQIYDDGKLPEAINAAIETASKKPELDQSLLIKALENHSSEQQKSLHALVLKILK